MDVVVYSSFANLPSRLTSSLTLSSSPSPIVPTTLLLLPSIHPSLLGCRDVDASSTITCIYYILLLRISPPHRTAPHRTAPHRTAPHRTAPHRTAPHRTAPHRTAPHRTAPHRTAPHRTAPHRTAPHRTAPHRTAPHRTAPHRTAPHRTTPHHTTPPSLRPYALMTPFSNRRRLVCELYHTTHVTHATTVIQA